MQKKYQLYGIGNGILDILGNISETDFSKLMLTKGSMNLVHSDVQKKILKALGNAQLTFASGGSVANSMIAFQALGGKSAFGCVIGDDSYGKLYQNGFKEVGLDLVCNVLPGGMTGTSIILITPDAERTMNTSLGVAAELTGNDIDEEIVRQSEWIYIEGYLLSQVEKGFNAALRIAEIAKNVGTKVALTFSDGFLVSGFRRELDTIVKLSDLIFANTNEASTYTGLADEMTSFTALKNVVPNVVMTRSERGALIHFDGQDYKLSAVPSKPIDLTGAGDAFAGAFLYGITNGFTPEESGKAACFLAHKTILQIGPRLPSSDFPLFWNEALKGN